MKPSTGAAVRLHRNAVRDRPESLSAFTNGMPVRHHRRRGSNHSEYDHTQFMVTSIYDDDDCCK
jgi:hypothetical protein